ENLLRARLDETGFVEAKGVETDRVLGIVLAPLGVRHVPKGLKRVVVALRVALVNEEPCGPLRLEHADVGGFHHRPDGSLCRYWVLPDKVAMSGHDTAKVMRPRDRKSTRLNSSH